MCVCACVRACVRACVCVYGRMRMYAYICVHSLTFVVQYTCLTENI